MVVCIEFAKRQGAGLEVKASPARPAEKGQLWSAAKREPPVELARAGAPGVTKQKISSARSKSQERVEPSQVHTMLSTATLRTGLAPKPCSSPIEKSRPACSGSQDDK